MASQIQTEYERRRLENIKRNGEMLSALKIQSTLHELSVSTKPKRICREKKTKTETLSVARCSLRIRGEPPEFPFVARPPRSSGEGKQAATFESLARLCESENFGCPEMDNRVKVSVDLGSLKLEQENIARVGKDPITAVQFIPSMDMRVIVVGNRLGDIGLWNVDSNGIKVYRPHLQSVTSIAIHPFSISKENITRVGKVEIMALQFIPSTDVRVIVVGNRLGDIGLWNVDSNRIKIYTGGWDGIRLMDVEKETFDLVYFSGDNIFSVFQPPNDVNSLYFGEGSGGLHIWDGRAGTCISSWNLHRSRINSIDFNSGNTNIMATSSSDETACIWDLRKINADKPQCLQTVNYKKSVYSAYFSPSGSLLATTRRGNKVGLLSGANYEHVSMIYHDKAITLSDFRAIWGWDDSSVFKANNAREVDIISVAGNRDVVTLESPYISAIPSHLAVHPYKVGMLVGATSVGHIYMWTSC